jgi:galactonate dehydratase
MPDPLVIDRVVAHPLKARLPVTQVTGARAFPEIELVVVEVTTRCGLTGWGECLGRTGSVAYASVVESLLAPAILGEDARDAGRLFAKMQRLLTGRSGGMLIEAIAGVDIALWDVMGKAAGLPVAKLLGGIGRAKVDAYASSINWTDDKGATAEIEAALELGFRQIKVKIGKPVDRALARCALARRVAGDEVKLSVDSNWAYDIDEAVEVAAGLADLGYWWFEEPLVPEDVAGYRMLRAKSRVRLAAGESDFTVEHARDLAAERLVGVIQPDVARAGGISETRRIADLADAFHVAYAPHVGWSGAICAAASLQLAAYAPNFLTFECMVFANPLRDAFTTPLAGDRTQLVEGQLEVPQAPGLGVEVDRSALERFRA